VGFGLTNALLWNKPDFMRWRWWLVVALG